MMNQKAKEEWDKKHAEEADKNKKQTEVLNNLCSILICATGQNFHCISSFTYPS
jgi:hypothetical protein